MVHPTTISKMLVLILLLGGFRLSNTVAQNVMVYPGDATNNGVVNNVDLLALGLAYNFNGPKRDTIEGSNIAFVPNEVVLWDLQLPGGLNSAFSDCNGNGRINYEDAWAIYTNYGERREDIVVEEDEFVVGEPGLDPVLGFDKSGVSNLLIPNQSFDLPIVLGTEDIPAEDVYGLAFSVFTSAQFQAEKHFDFTEESWANDDGDRIFLYKDITPRRSDIAWTRTDRNQRDGHGIIGVAEFIIIVDVIDKVAPIQIWTDSIRMIDKYGNITALAGDTVTFQWHPSAFLPTSGVNEAGQIRRLSVQPNPASDWLHLVSDAPMQSAQLFNLMGQLVRQIQIPRTKIADMQVLDLPTGSYLLSVETETGLERKLITIH